MKGSHVQWLVYSMVARGDVVLAHYSAFPTASKSFAALAVACLANLRAATSAASSSSSSADAASRATINKMISYTCNDTTFHFLIKDHFTYLVVSDDSEGDEIALSFLCRIKEDFDKRYGDAATNNELFKAHSLDKDFGPRLKEHMQYCLDNSEKLKRHPSTRDQVLQVQEIVADNIEKVLDTSGRIELNLDHNEKLRAHVENFHRQGRQLKKKLWIQQVKLRLLVFCISTVIILSIWLIICKGFKC